MAVLCCVQHNNGFELAVPLARLSRTQQPRQSLALLGPEPAAQANVRWRILNTCLCARTSRANILYVMSRSTPRFAVPVLAFIFFLGVPTLYFVFRDRIISEWNSIESAVALGSYLIATFQAFYNSNYKLFLFVQRLILRLRHDYTSWELTARYWSVLDFDIGSASTALSDSTARIVQSSDDYLAFIWQERILIELRLQPYGDQLELFIKTAKFDVPMRVASRRMSQLSQLLETIGNYMRQDSGAERMFELRIDYGERSPFYSYWLRRLPEQSIQQFDCKVRLPNSANESLWVSKNSLSIRAKLFSALSSDALDVVNLKGLA